MNDSAPPTFPLDREPWLPCQDLTGSTVEHGILGTLTSAHEIRRLAGDIPTQTFALNRLLLAVLHGALGPPDLDRWQELWEAPRLPVQPITEYLAQHGSRFDLLHPETPFFQVPGLRTAKDETSDLSKLIADVPNGVRFFSTRQGAALSLSYAEAARWVVHCQAFDFSGIKSGAVGDDRVRGGRGYPIGVGWSGWLGGLLLEGATLKETLMLNLLPRDDERYGRDPALDLPAWERAPSTAAQADLTGRPTGPVDLYTWQTRRIRLVPDGGRVSRVLISNGDKIDPPNRHTAEPHTGWRRSQAQEKALKLPLVYMPRAHDPDRAIWRGLQSLLPAAPATAQEVPPPGVLAWLDRLIDSGVVEEDRLLAIDAVSMVYGSQMSVTADVVHDVLDLPAHLARTDATELAGVVVSCVEVADRAVRAVGNLAGDLISAAGGDGTGRRSRIMEGLYADLDAPFRTWLRTLRADSAETETQIVWHATVRRLATAVADELLRDIPSACWEGRRTRDHLLTAAHAEARFWKDLRAALPFAFTDPPEERTAS